MPETELELVHKSDLPRKSEAEQAAFFETVLQRSLIAEGRAGVVEHFFDVAETVVRIAFAGDTLARLLVPALAHLEIAPSPSPDVTFHIWDSQSTGVAMAAAPCTRTAYTDRGEIWGMDSTRIRSAFHWGEFCLNLMNTDTNTGIYWVKDAQTLPYWAKAAPFRTLFHWWMECNRCQLLHAATVGRDGGGVLITGRGGIGKSSTALTCLAAGLEYVGDDYVIARYEPTPRVFSLYSTAKINADQIERFPQFRAMIANMGSLADEKAVIHLYPDYAHSMARSLSLKAALTPRIAPQFRSEVAATSKLALQRAAAFTTMSQLPHASYHTYEFVQRLIGELPCLELVLGTARDGVATALGDLLSMPGEHIAALSPRQPAAAGNGVTLVSVIIPVYNGARFLPHAVANILGQNYPSLEIIVVDDGSTDDIDAVVAALPVEVRYLKQENSGAAAARNRGVTHASAELIAFLDVDDLWPENVLGQLVETLEQNPQFAVVRGFSQYVTTNEDTGRLEYIGNPRESFPYSIGHGLFRRSAFQKVGLFDIRLKFGEDADWFIRAQEKGLNIEQLDQITLLVRRHEHNMTRRKSVVELTTLRIFKNMLDRQRTESASVGEV